MTDGRGRTKNCSSGGGLPGAPYFHFSCRFGSSVEKFGSFSSTRKVQIGALMPPFCSCFFVVFLPACPPALLIPFFFSFGTPTSLSVGLSCSVFNSLAPLLLFPFPLL